jgi:hypothetical protein
MNTSSIRSGFVIRGLLVAAVVVTAVATHLVDRSRQATAPLMVTEIPDPVDEMVRAAKWLNEYYASPEGLQRPNGLWIDGHPDYEGIAVWLFNTYVRERLGGATEQEARLAVTEHVQRSDEWRAKHPQAPPSR